MNDLRLISNLLHEVARTFNAKKVAFALLDDEAQVSVIAEDLENPFEFQDKSSNIVQLSAAIKVDRILDAPLEDDTFNFVLEKLQNEYNELRPKRD